MIMPSFSTKILLYFLVASKFSTSKYHLNLFECWTLDFEKHAITQHLINLPRRFLIVTKGTDCI